MSTIKPGDKFRSLDKRDVEPRIVEVTNEPVMAALVKTVQHWDEERIGKHHWVRVASLLNDKLWQRISH